MGVFAGIIKSKKKIVQSSKRRASKPKVAMAEVNVARTGLCISISVVVVVAAAAAAAAAAKRQRQPWLLMPQTQGAQG